MREYILWSNCNNCCKFCWQQKKHDLSTFLNEKEMITSIQTTISELDKINVGDDVLLVGGELFCYKGIVDKTLKELIDRCIILLKNNTIRFLYINTNLINKISTDGSLFYLLDKITENNLESKLKFTTSFDIYGRFKKDALLQWLSCLRYITITKYPTINVVINCIITKQLVEVIEKEDIKDWQEFKYICGAKYINFIPYIPVPDDHSMDVTFKDIVKVLAAQEKIEPGYIDRYIDDFDMNQNKVLYEYHKDKGYVECTAKYAECHHNENFKKVLGNDECYICKLKEIFR